MSNPARSLNAHVPHRRLLDLLGCTVRTQGLPQRTRCPICQQGLLHVVEDPSCGGEWFWCQGCGESGDMIELATLVWRLDIPATIARLARRGFDLPADPGSVARYQREHLDYRERLQELWRRANDPRQWRSGRLRERLARLGVQTRLSEERWMNGSGALLGCLDAASIESCFCPQAMQHARTKGHACNPSQRAIFRGGGWGDVLVIPFEDLPGRICSFLFIGREADAARDIIFKRANWGPKVNQHDRPAADAGLAMHPRTLEAADEWEQTVIAIGDPILAMRLQCRHFEHHLHPLPIAVWFDSDRDPDWLSNGRPIRTLQSWQRLGQRQVVFWMPAFDFAALRAAIETNGSISTVGPQTANEQSLREYCWKQMPDELLRHVQHHARPWPEVLSQHLQKLSAAGVEELLCHFEQEGADVEQIIRRCDPGTRLRVARIQSATEMPRRVELGGRTLLETNGTWQLVNRNRRLELISDAVLRLDAVVSVRHSNQSYYAGRVLYQDSEVEFCDLRERIERDPFIWMRDLLLQRQVGYAIFNPGWSRKAIHVAELFQQPEMIDGASTVGWDEENMRFVFPWFAVHLGGDVKPIEYAIFPDDAPGGALEEPIVLSGEEVDRPAEQEGLAALFWAVAAGIAANILAPAFNGLPAGIALEGTEASRAAEEIAESLGCVAHHVGCARQVHQALEREHSHGWPCVYRVLPGVQPRHWRKLLSDDGHDFRNCVVGVDWDTAQALRMRPGWNVIAADGCARADRDMLELARRLLPAYLRYVCQRGLRLVDWDDSEESFMERVVRDLAGFVVACHGDPDAVLEAHRVLSADREEGDADAFADLLAQLVKERRLKIAPNEDGRGRATMIELPDRDALQMRHSTLAKLLKRVEAPTIGDIAMALRGAGVLIEEREDGWIFAADWFWKRQRMVEQLNSGQLKLHG